MPELWIVDTHERPIEVWRQGTEAPERVEDVITWRVGEAELDLPLAEVFRDV